MMFGLVDESELNSFVAVPSFDVDQKSLKKCHARTDGIIDCNFTESQLVDDALNLPLTTPEEMVRWIESHEERTFEKLKVFE